MRKAVFNWSGGKDSSLALYRVLKSKEYDIKYLLTSVNEHYRRISMHGVRIELLEQQAESIGIPLIKMMMPEMPSMQLYEQIMKSCMETLTKEGITTSVFGDIFLEDLRKYREEKLSLLNFNASFPIWHLSTTELIKEFIDCGFKAVLVCVSEKKLDKSFAGREIDDNFLKDLPKDVDPCGEYGEYHSFVYDGPIFKKPIPFKIGEVVHKSYAPRSQTSTNYDTGFWYCDLVTV